MGMNNWSYLPTAIYLLNQCLLRQIFVHMYVEMLYRHEINQK